MSATALVQAPRQATQRLSARDILEASVHLPRRGKLYVASFRDENGRQRWKATGLADRRAALIVAQEWEAEARRRRAAQVPQQSKALIRVRRGSGTGERGQFTQKEVAFLLGLSERAIREIEKRAVEKLRRHPALRQLWREYQTGEIEEGSSSEMGQQLSRSEIAALYGLVRTPAERELLSRFFVYAGVNRSR
jgi:hypothetical protein